MKKIRNNCFETNSSSTHALCIDRECIDYNIKCPECLIEDGKIVLKHRNIINPNIENNYIKFDTFIQRLYYLIGYTNDLGISLNNFEASDRVCRIVSEYFNMPVENLTDDHNRIWGIVDSEEEMDHFYIRATDDDIKYFLFGKRSCVNISPLGTTSIYDFNWKPENN